jgi:hypothetical protein
MILQLSAVDWSDLLWGSSSDAIYECFELFVPKYIVKNCTVKCPWFDREFHDVDNNNTTKATKSLKEFETLHVRRCPNRNSACTIRLSTVFGNLGTTLRVFTV